MRLGRVSPLVVAPLVPAPLPPVATVTSAPVAATGGEIGCLSSAVSICCSWDTGAVHIDSSCEKRVLVWCIRVGSRISPVITGTFILIVFACIWC